MKKERILKEKDFIKEYFKKKNLKYIIVILIHIIGFIYGMNQFQKNYLEEIKDSEIVTIFSNYDEIIKSNPENIIKRYINIDFSDWIIVVFLSFSIFSIPLLLFFVFIKSISLGITISSFVYLENSLIKVIITFLIPTILKLIIISITLSSSYKFLNNILRLKKDIKYELIRQAIVLGILFIFNIFLVLYRYVSIIIIRNIMF